MSTRMAYNTRKRRAVFTFPSGHQMTVRGLTQEHAQRFFERNIPEFEKRDGCLQSSGGAFERAQP